jgi:hypothetical protein
MNEQQWLTSTDPGALLAVAYTMLNGKAVEWMDVADGEALRSLLADKVAKPGCVSCSCCRVHCRQQNGCCPLYRKLRLFACACSCRILSLLSDAVCHEAVEALDKDIEGQIRHKSYETAVFEFDRVRGNRYPMTVSLPEDDAWTALYCAVHRKWLAHFDEYPDERWKAARVCASDAALATWRKQTSMETGWRGPTDAEIAAAIREQPEYAAQSNVLRDIIGNPFRSATIRPDWLAWNDGTVRRIAQAIYDERAFDRMPILADALEDAGCDNADILNHCRNGGEHVRGCWVVDLVLGRS